MPEYGEFSGISYNDKDSGKNVPEPHILISRL
jgi:hypothetical protein